MWVVHMKDVPNPLVGDAKQLILSLTCLVCWILEVIMNPVDLKALFLLATFFGQVVYNRALRSRVVYVFLMTYKLSTDVNLSPALIFNTHTLLTPFCSLDLISFEELCKSSSEAAAPVFAHIHRQVSASILTSAFLDGALKCFLA